MADQTKRRWCPEQQEYVEAPQADAFIEAVIALAKEHGFTIGHEDGHGAFELNQRGDNSERDADMDEWLRQAHVEVPR